MTTVDSPRHPVRRGRRPLRAGGALATVLLVAVGALGGITVPASAAEGGTVVGWGDARYGQSTPPPGLDDVTAISADFWHSLALRADGTVVAWGLDDEGQTDVPPGLGGVVAVSAGGSFSLALKDDGTVVGWGLDDVGQTDVPPGLTGVVAISAGGAFSLALKDDGTVVAWGSNSYGQTDVPPGLTGVVAISAGGAFSLALKGDGTVVAWGYDAYGQTDVPSGLTGVVAISAGDFHNLALKDDGTVVAWGLDDVGQTDVPSGLTGVVTVSAGGFHSLALKGDGTVVAWGSNNLGQSSVPPGLSGATAVAAGAGFSLAIVAPANQPPTNDAGGPYAGSEGSSVTLRGSAEDVDGDTLTNTWSYTPVSGVDPGATCSFADAHALATSVTCTDDGVFRLTLTTSDGENPAVRAESDLAIQNAAPVVTAVTVTGSPVAVRGTVTLAASYRDPGTHDTHVATVSWGDSSTSTATAVDGKVGATHTYSSAGIHRVCVTVTDDDGASGTGCAARDVVVYDPAAGFVTGGGWIGVPAGSLPAHPTVSGKAEFETAARYQRGSVTPTGSTELSLAAAHLTFRSTSYDWLVVTGSTATVRGSGTVNGVPGHEFVATAVDGGRTGADRLRIRIWRTATGTVVLDNEIGQTDETVATTPIGRGSIVVHR